MGNILEFGIVFIQRLFVLKFGICAGKGSDEDNKPEFDVAFEYLEVFYRQFICYLGMTVFPLMPVLSLIANLIEYFLDKVKMVKLCQKPKRLDLSMKGFLMVWLLVIAAAGLASYP